MKTLNTYIALVVFLFAGADLYFGSPVSQNIFRLHRESIQKNNPHKIAAYEVQDIEYSDYKMGLMADYVFGSVAGLGLTSKLLRRKKKK